MPKIIIYLVVIVCLLILYFGILKPLYNILIAPTLAKLMHIVYRKLEKTPLEKEREALQAAQEEMKAVELQRERVRIEKQAMRIRDSIIEEEFEELNNEHKESRSKSV